MLDKYILFMVTCFLKNIRIDNESNKSRID